MFHFKLALDSLKKNKATYSPFLLAGMASVAFNFLVQMLIYSKGVRDLEMAPLVIVMLILGQIVIGIISIVILIYTYSFLRKGKQREFGLYSILGLRKSDLVKISLIQQLISFLICTVGGLVSGYVFARILILLLIKMLGGSSFNLSFSWASILFTTLFFLIAFLILSVIDAFSLYRTSTLSLLHSDKASATAPKKRWILFILGSAALVFGYWLSLTVPGPVEALLRFFSAALLIIVATYFLFIAGTTLLLKMLQNNERYYYRTQHFVTVSNLLFRMKQNAVGLASIALLSTMTLVVTVTTASMFFGKSDVLNQMLPRDNAVTVLENTLSQSKIEELAQKNKLKTSDFYSSRASSSTMAYLTKDNRIVPWSETKSKKDKKQHKRKNSNPTGDRHVQFMTQADYEKLTGDKTKLASSEVILYCLTNDPNNRTAIQIPDKEVTVAQKKYQVKKNLDSVPKLPTLSSDLVPSMLIVMPDENQTKMAAESLLTKASDKKNVMSVTYFFNSVGSFEDTDSFMSDLEEAIGDAPHELNNKEVLRKVMNALYGAFFFIGILFSLSFTFVTGLMVYYKQISEGRADQKQFTILQKVGMSKESIRRAIHSQILWLFGLPVVVSVIHLAFAMVMIQKLLLAFAIPMSPSVYIIMISTILLMVFIYFLIYVLTSKTYYKQVTSFNN